MLGFSSEGVCKVFNGGEMSKGPHTFHMRPFLTFNPFQLLSTYY